MGEGAGLLAGRAGREGTGVTAGPPDGTLGLAEGVLDAVGGAVGVGEAAGADS